MNEVRSSRHLSSDSKKVPASRVSAIKRIKNMFQIKLTDTRTIVCNDQLDVCTLFTRVKWGASLPSSAFNLSDNTNPSYFIEIGDKARFCFITVVDAYFVWMNLAMSQPEISGKPTSRSTVSKVCFSNNFSASVPLYAFVQR